MKEYRIKLENMNRIYQKPQFIEKKLPMIRKDLKWFDVDEFEKIGNIDVLINELTKLKENNPEFQQYKIETDYDNDYLISSIKIIGIREETDNEYNKRKENYELGLKMWEEQQLNDTKLALKKEKELYNQLKKKYDKNK